MKRRLSVWAYLMVCLVALSFTPRSSSKSYAGGWKCYPTSDACVAYCCDEATGRCYYFFSCT